MKTPSGAARRRITVVVSLLVGSALVAACGGSSSGSTPLKIYAASSLHGAFSTLASDFERAHPGVQVQLEFDGTDQLAAQIEEGAPADVFAGASTKYGDQLQQKGLLTSAPVIFATNRLTAAAPATGGAADLAAFAKPGERIVIGSEGVPIGDYTRKVLTQLDGIEGAGYAGKVLANVVSQEPKVTGIVAKLASGDADGGFVYVTDVAGAKGSLRAIPVPASIDATATYPLAAVKASKQQSLAAQWIALVQSAQGQSVLRAAGFGPSGG